MTHPDELEVTTASLQQLLAGEVADYEAEMRYVRADGRILWGLMHVSLVRAGSGEPLYAIGQIQDVTEQKHAQEQLAFQAHHDRLTSLPNRRKLMEDLEARLPVATRSEPLLLMLLDLDGFKAYNDSFGHPAGDALLSRLGRRLAKAVDGHGQGYRVGGDEFCVLGPAGADGPASLAVVAATSLFDYGDGFEITASYGSVTLPMEAASSSEALRKADQRMYDQKGSGRASAGRQAASALQTALSERSADLGDHLSDVTDLCTAVARALELPEEHMDPLFQAAALHDVGKIAIPDSILHKPAALDDAEWEFMRTHTLIGERILEAAPALWRAAKLVRASHERFDGQGYPDGLAGEDIPIESRITAVCDAYDAMTSDRPFRRAMSAEEAVGELRRGAGSQFDPRVVEAFVVGIAAHGRTLALAEANAQPA